jgi:hypothetical protein
MRSAWVLTSAVGAVLVLSICSQPTIAADTKKFSGRGSLVIIETNELPVAGNADIKPSLIRMDGTLLSDDRADPPKWCALPSRRRI